MIGYLTIPYFPGDIIIFSLVFDESISKLKSHDVYIMSEIVFSSIVGHPELIDTVAGWLWGFWGTPQNYDFYRSMVVHSKEDDIPLVYVAFVDGTPAGTVALLRADLFSRQDLCPWLADLYVRPEYRSHGLGSALQGFALAEAKKRGYKEIYLYSELTGYYERNGWAYLGDEIERDGKIVRIYKKSLA
jgi:GNAT superfamily N-acetyltransferase